MARLCPLLADIWIWVGPNPSGVSTWEKGSLPAQSSPAVPHPGTSTSQPRGTSWGLSPRSCHHIHGLQGHEIHPARSHDLQRHRLGQCHNTWKPHLQLPGGNLEMWLASVGAHLHPLVASTHYQPGEALEKAKPHLLVRKRFWSHLALCLCLPEDQGPHHALQLSLEGTSLPGWPLSPPGSAQVPGGQGQPQQPPQHSDH